MSDRRVRSQETELGRRREEMSLFERGEPDRDVWTLYSETEDGREYGELERRRAQRGEMGGANEREMRRRGEESSEVGNDRVAREADPESDERHRSWSRDLEGEHDVFNSEATGTG
ncbi:unnamed protein product [Boreogadus saida]